MIVLILNGPINAGKTTTGRALAALWTAAEFVEGDDHGAADETPFDEMVEMAFSRLERVIAAAERELVIAYPLRDEDFARLKRATESRGARLIVVTLAPQLSEAFVNRGTRELTSGEVARAREMHDEGYASRAFSDMVITDMQRPDETARRIAERFGLLA